MRIALLLSAVSLFAVACGNASSSETASESAESSAAAGERHHTFWCLQPKGHPFSGYGEVWSVDITSGFGPPITKNIRRTTGFYWFGAVTHLAQPGAATWAIHNTVEGDATQVYGDSDQGTIAIDITGQPGVSAVGGEIDVTPMSGDPEVISIAAGEVCADG